MIDKKNIFIEYFPGVYNNQQQTFSNPFHFPLVRYNIELLPYKFERKQILFRIEQYRPHSGVEPYRIGYVSIEQIHSEILLRNFLIPDYPSFETASHLAQLDSTLLYDPYRRVFKGSTRGHIRKDSKLIMVLQEFELGDTYLKVLDRGYDMATDKLMWGSDHGAFELKKEKNYATTSRID